MLHDGSIAMLGNMAAGAYRTLELGRARIERNVSTREMPDFEDLAHSKRNAKYLIDNF